MAQLGTEYKVQQRQRQVSTQLSYDLYFYQLLLQIMLITIAFLCNSTLEQIFIRALQLNVHITDTDTDIRFTHDFLVNVNTHQQPTLGH